MRLSALYDRYVFKQLALTTVFTTIVLTLIILLTQSLKFLELIINSGASSSSFWILTLLALPRFFEVILPIALMIACLFIYNKMASDSEITVMRAAGVSPMQLARPAILLAIIATIFLMMITTWLAPSALANMVKMRQVIKTQYSALLLREGIFNNVGQDLTVYIDNRNSAGELEGLLIHDSRPELPTPVTIIAKRGVIVSSDAGQQVLVYEGSRQDFNKKTGALNRLNFDRYSIDLPEPEAVKKRWKEPDERNFLELLKPNLNNVYDAKYKDQFIVEAHKRIVNPFLALSFTIIALVCLLLGPVSRRGQGKRVFVALIAIVTLQSLHLSSFNFFDNKLIGLGILYFITFFPIAFGLFALSSYAENFRHRIMYPQARKKTARMSA